jgi:hypothetical protein
METLQNPHYHAPDDYMSFATKNVHYARLMLASEPIEIKAMDHSTSFEFPEFFMKSI